MKNVSELSPKEMWVLKFKTFLAENDDGEAYDWRLLADPDDFISERHLKRKYGHEDINPELYTFRLDVEKRQDNIYHVDFPCEISSYVEDICEAGPLRYAVGVSGKYARIFGKPRQFTLKFNLFKQITIKTCVNFKSLLSTLYLALQLIPPIIFEKVSQSEIEKDKTLDEIEEKIFNEYSIVVDGLEINLNDDSITILLQRV